MTTALVGRSISVRNLFLACAGPLTLAVLLSGSSCRAEDAPQKPAAAARTSEQRPERVAAELRNQSPHQREERIEAALGEPTSIEFVETPLSDVLDFLKDLHAIEIQLDTKALDAASIGSDTPVTRNLKNISLSAALRQLLGHLGLTYVVRDEVLLITTPDAAREMVDVRVYAVNDLAAGGEAAALAGIVQRALTGAPLEPARSLPAPAQFGVGGVPTGAPTGAATASGSRAVVNQEFNIVSIEPFRDSLIVRANYHGHKATEGLLAELCSKLTKVQAMPAAKPVSPAAASPPAR